MQELREKEDPCSGISEKRKAPDGEIDLNLSLKIASREEMKIDNYKRMRIEGEEENEEVLERRTDLSLSLCSHY